MDVGEKLGKYEIRGVLGRGAMGVVYDGWDPLIQRRVAIKTIRLLHEDEDAEAAEGLARFRREAQAAGRLQHPNVVGVYDYGETGEFAYLVMEFVDGRSVKAALDAQERFPIPEVARVMRDLLDALQYSHEHGVVHRDIKPANMMLTPAGRVKVADFGVARIESSSMTQVGTVIGTPAYMSPEQLAGQTVDSRSDIYSAGVVLYQLLTGDRPYHGNNLTSIYHQAMNAEPVPPSKLAVTVPPAFDPVVARAMAKRPGERYATAAEFAGAIDAAATESPAEFGPEEGDATVVTRSVKPAAARPAPRPTAPAPAAARPRSSRTPMFVGAAALVLVLAGGGAWYLTRPTVPAAPQHAENTPPSTPQQPNRTPATPPKLADNTPPATPPQHADNTPPATPPKLADTTPPSTPPRAADTTPPATPPKLADNTPPATPPRPADNTPPATPPRQAGNTAQPQPPQQAMIPPSPDALRRSIAAAIGPVGCALVGGNVANAGENVLLTGVALRGTSVDELHRAVSDTAPAAAVDWQVASFDGPYCRALDTVRPIAAGFGAPGNGFAMRLRSGNRPLIEGQLMTIDFTMPNYPAWLRVDYLQHDGTVWHVHPNAKNPARQYAPGAHVSLGDPSTGGEAWAVGEPFGTDMIIAVASSEPLFTQGRKEFEKPAEGYLVALRAAIEAAQRRNERLAADALVLTTEPKR